jgi:hypothetical protein
MATRMLPSQAHLYPKIYPKINPVPVSRNQSRVNFTSTSPYPRLAEAGRRGAAAKSAIGGRCDPQTLFLATAKRFRALACASELNHHPRLGIDFLDTTIEAEAHDGTG